MNLHEYLKSQFFPFGIEDVHTKLEVMLTDKWFSRLTWDPYNIHFKPYEAAKWDQNEKKALIEETEELIEQNPRIEDEYDSEDTSAEEQESTAWQSPTNAKDDVNMND